MQALLEIMRRLRGPGGCPWDQEQTHLSLRPYLLEEAAEAVEAIGAGEPEAMADELGDVLLQVAFHSVIAEGEGTFNYETVERSICDKLIRRHPHVFGNAHVENSAEVLKNWESIKQSESTKKKTIPPQLPTLMRAEAYGKSQPDCSQQELGQKIQGMKLNSESLAEVAVALTRLAKKNGIQLEFAVRDYLDARSEDSGNRP
jgi:XTP/dITP diphosphohydrolase